MSSLHTYIARIMNTWFTRIKNNKRLKKNFRFKVFVKCKATKALYLIKHKVREIIALHNFYRFLTFTIMWKKFFKPNCIIHSGICLYMYLSFYALNFMCTSICYFPMYICYFPKYLLFYNHRSSYTGLVHGSIPSADSSKYRRVSVPSKNGPRLDEIKKSLRSEKSNDCL